MLGYFTAPPKRAHCEESPGSKSEKQATLDDSYRQQRRSVNGQGKTSANGQGETSANDQGETSANDAGEPSAKRRKPHDRQWDDYCMAVALLTRERSKDPRTQVGACIVNMHKQIVSIGYNGMPVGCHDDLPWGKAKDKAIQEEDKHNYVCHAEMNALVNRTSTGYNLQGCTIYTTYSPCTECAKLIVQSGIEEVVYGSVYKTDDAKTTELMGHANITYRKYENYRNIVVTIDLENGKVSSCEADTEPSSHKARDTDPSSHEASGTDPSSHEASGTDSPSKEDSGKPRQVDLKWRDYHMAMAFLLSVPFYDDQEKIDSWGGACIVNEERRTVGTGSSDYPKGCNEKLWSSFQDDKQLVNPVCHAEMNAILNRMVPSLKKCTIYTTVFPCNKCAQLIVQSGITRIVFAKEMEEEHMHSQKLLDLANVDYKKYNTWTSKQKTAKKVKIVIDLRKVAEKDAIHME